MKDDEFTKIHRGKTIYQRNRTGKRKTREYKEFLKSQFDS